MEPLPDNWLQSYMQPSTENFFERCQFLEVAPKGRCSSSLASELYSINGTPRKCFTSGCDLWCVARWIANPDTDPKKYGDTGGGNTNGIGWWMLSLVAVAGVLLLPNKLCPTGPPYARQLLRQRM